MRKTLITGASVVLDGALQTGVSLLLAEGRIAEVFRETPPNLDAERIDAKGQYLLPAFIELHAHGGGGYDFADATKSSFTGVMNTHLAHGVTLLCPTLVSCEWERTLAFLELCESFGKHSAMFGGVHLEGPFLSPLMCGAQKPSVIIAPSEREIAALEEHAGVLSCISAAPEIDGVDALARRMTAKGVSLSVGHSNADAKTMQKALSLGFSRITHLFSATSRRAKQGSYVVGGIEETALLEEGFTVELIADGHHVCKESFLLTEKCKGRDGIALVSDAMRGAGCAGLTESYLGEILPENRVIIEDGVAKLPDRSSFAGSVAVGDTMVAALVGRYGLPLATVSHMMSAVPARLLGLADKRGRIEKGLEAELVLLDASYKTVKVFSKAVC